MQDYHNDIEIGPHPEKFDIRSYKHFLYIDAFLKFNSGYSLGLDMQELLPEVHIMVRNLIDTRKMRDVGYAYMENILYFIILFNLSEKIDNAGFLSGFPYADAGLILADKHGKALLPEIFYCAI